MSTFAFTLNLDGPRIIDDLNALDALMQAGCDDALFGERNGAQYADFDREAPSFEQAVLSAISDIESTMPDMQVFRIETDDLVSAANIASRTGRSRESIRLLVDGKRGPGNFPAPAMRVGKSTLWHWADVMAWFHAYEPRAMEDGEDVAFIAAMNAALEFRRTLGALDSTQQVAVKDWTRSQVQAV